MIAAQTRFDRMRKHVPAPRLSAPAPTNPAPPDALMRALGYTWVAEHGRYGWWGATTVKGHWRKVQ